MFGRNFQQSLIASFTQKQISNYIQKSRQTTNYSGLSFSNKNNAQFIEPPYFIDKFAVALLHFRQDICKEQKIKLCFVSQKTKSKEHFIYRYFQEEYYLIDGHKFGCLFLAYNEDPDRSHAQYLIFNGQYNENHITRLADLCKKKSIFVEVKNQNQLTFVHCERKDEKKRTRPNFRDNKNSKDNKNEQSIQEQPVKKQKLQNQQ